MIITKAHLIHMGVLTQILMTKITTFQDKETFKDLRSILLKNKSNLIKKILLFTKGDFKKKLKEQWSWMNHWNL